MSKKPVLVVMAAGMGSRYGGLKQIDPVGSHGEAILDYSLYDAYQAGFRTAVIVIKDAIREDFMQTVGKRLRWKSAMHIRSLTSCRMDSPYLRAVPSPGAPVTRCSAPRKPLTAHPSPPSMRTITTASLQ